LNGLHPTIPSFSWQEVSDPSIPLADSLHHLLLEAPDRFWRHMQRLQRLRDVFGKPITISSGYRCPAHNAAVGGAPASQHLIFATDLIFPGYAYRDRSTRWVHVIKPFMFHGIGFYEWGIHADCRSEDVITVWEEKDGVRRSWRTSYQP